MTRITERVPLRYLLLLPLIVIGILSILATGGGGRGGGGPRRGGPAR